MIRNLSVLTLVALVAGCTSSDRASAPAAERFDVVVYGGTSAGVTVMSTCGRVQEPMHTSIFWM